jgi:DNA-directed RNA polymerase subunit RPC12/RpoP
MGFLDSLEKLINEHGSATILKERISLLNDQHAFIEKQVLALKEQVVNLQRENESLKIDKRQLQEQVVNFAAKHSQNTNPLGYVCDHCGSQRLKRTGSRPDPTFGPLGIKQAVFNCEECGKESGFTQNP